MGIADQKSDTRRYRVVPRTLCFVTHGNDVLLLHGAPTKRNWPNNYNGIGGHVEANEDIYTSAIREIREETELEVSDLSLRGVVNISGTDPSTGITMFVFTATANTRRVSASSEGTPEWVSRGSVGELDLVEDLPTILPIVLCMGPEEPPFFAHYSYDAHDNLHIHFAQST